MDITNMTLTGFHGTSIKYLKDILDNDFKTNERPDHWLGQGIYFYDNQALAQWWAETKFRDKRLVRVVETQIKVPKSHFWDLDHFGTINQFFEEVNKLLSTGGLSFRFKKDPTRNFCYLLDVLKKMLDIKVVVMTFFKPNPKYGKEDIALFQQHNFVLPVSLIYKEKQICLTDSSTIVSKICNDKPTTKLTWR